MGGRVPVPAGRPHALQTQVWGLAPANPAREGAFRPLAWRTGWHLRRKSHGLLWALKHLMLNTSARWRGHFCTTYPAHQTPQDQVNLRRGHRALLLSRDCEPPGLIRGGQAGTPEP